MSLLTGIIGAAGEPVKLSTSIGTLWTANAVGGSLTFPFNANAGSIRLVLHYVEKSGGSVLTPDTITNYTSLHTYNDGVAAVRVQYRLFSSDVATETLPSQPGDITSQFASVHSLSPASGFSFIDMSLVNQNYQSYTSGSQSTSLNANKNDVSLGAIIGEVGDMATRSGTLVTNGTENAPTDGIVRGHIYARSITQTETQTLAWTSTATTRSGIFTLRPTFS
jgi:hypothetical protein